MTDTQGVFVVQLTHQGAMWKVSRGVVGGLLEDLSQTGKEGGRSPPADLSVQG